MIVLRIKYLVYILYFIIKSFFINILKTKSSYGNIYMEKVIKNDDLDNIFQDH